MFKSEIYKQLASGDAIDMLLGKILCWYEPKDTPKQYLCCTNAVYNKCNI